MTRWFIGFQKVYNDRGRVAHLMFPGFVVSEKALREWSPEKVEQHLLLQLEEGDVVVRRLAAGKCP